MDPLSAEMTKYAANTMLATRISFMNEISALCEKLGADVELIRQGIGSDLRIGRSFLFPGIGYGGSCFPKDIRALIYAGSEHGIEMSVVKAVQQVNIIQQQRFAGRVTAYFAGKEKQTTLAVWGLAFKAKTDDIRESPAIFCVEKFLDCGIKIKAYDPQAASAAAEALDGRIETVAGGYDALDGADGLVILTDWQEFRNPDFELIASKLNKPVIFDGRNLYDPKILERSGFEYYSIGRADIT
jgi:UDPglucose 6-dehydrogenase